MKRVIVALSVFAALCGCNDKNALGAKGEPELFGARFKEGRGVELSDITRASLHVETAPAVEISSADSVSLASAVPASSLLRTVNGAFVYVVNGKHYLRTEVKTGAQRGDLVEINDGLYPGDEVVKRPVNLLWYAELQALRGGTSCTDDH